MVLLKYTHGWNICNEWHDFKLSKAEFKSFQSGLRPSSMLTDDIDTHMFFAHKSLNIAPIILFILLYYINYT